MTSTTQTEPEGLIDRQSEVVHCDRCNSEVPRKDFLAKSWTGQTTPSCPNCGNTFAAQAPGISAAGVDPNAAGAGELRLCPRCGGTYHSLAANQDTGEIRPVRFCYRCGYRLMSD